MQLKRTIPGRAAAVPIISAKFTHATCVCCLTENRGVFRGRRNVVRDDKQQDGKRQQNGDAERDFVAGVGRKPIDLNMPATTINSLTHKALFTKDGNTNTTKK